MLDPVTAAPPAHLDTLYRECWEVLKPHLVSGKMGPLYRAGFDTAVRDGRLYTVRDDAGLLLAFLQVSTKPRLKCLNVDRVAVREGFQRRGLGRVLLEKAWTLAKEKNTLLRLRVANTNADAVAFYTRLGFTSVESSKLTTAMQKHA